MPTNFKLGYFLSEFKTQNSPLSLFLHMLYLWKASFSHPQNLENIFFSIFPLGKNYFALDQMWLYPSPLSAAIQLSNGCRIYPLRRWTPSKLYRSLFFFIFTHSTVHFTVTVLLQKVSKCVLVVLANVPRIYTVLISGRKDEETPRHKVMDECLRFRLICTQDFPSNLANDVYDVGSV